MALLTSVESEKRRKVKHANEATQFTTVDASAFPAGCFGGHLAPWMLLRGAPGSLDEGTEAQEEFGQAVPENTPCLGAWAERTGQHGKMV